MAPLLAYYHQLPPALRHSIASLRGYYLRHWRYGPETDRLAAEATERESWPAGRWEAWRTERLARLLHRTATRVPYYRDLWQRRRREGDTRSWEVLSHWPILTKEELRRDPAAFVADDCNRSRMFASQTSGTSGTPLRLWQRRESLRAYYALFEARWRKAYGVSRHDRWAILGGQLVTPVAQRTPPFWVHNRGLHQLYLSAYHLAPDLIRPYVEAIREFSPKYIWGYSSSLYTLAQECLRQGLTGLRFEVVLANAEPLYAYQREVIEQAFRSPVRETYGMTEMVAAASECAHGRLHLWPEVGVLEIHEPDSKGAGDFLGTSLINEDMPLIRYRVGDRGSLDDGVEACPCGRTLPLLGSIEGRADDVLVTPDGRRVGRLDPVFKADLRIREAQVVQEEIDAVTVLVVPDAAFGERDAHELEARLKERLGGGMRIAIRKVDAIPRGPNGKFRAVVCRIADRPVPCA